MDTTKPRASGCVRWPTHLPDTGEGGMFVVAVVPRDPSGDGYQDPFTCCFDATHLQVCGTELNLTNHDDSLRERLFAGSDRRGFATGAVLAWVMLGSTDQSYNRHGDTILADWEATRDDLTDEGRALVASLEALYGRPVDLLTFVDT